ncbi:MAG: RsmD family RNA methyltransferase [Opitutaceae bacterium]|nr:RsmD family RNA methyltransferase [Opitutaceae bacterium]
MRISGGLARGIPLLVPKGDAVRPATDGMRQAVFSSLITRVPGARFLDLFAGSGGYGLEAFSRGATGGMFVEKNAKAAACVRQNIAAVGKSMKAATDTLHVSVADAVQVPWVESAPPDLVFIDPPYELITEVAPRLFSRLTELLAPHTDPVIIFEMPGELTLEPPGWTCVKRLGKGAHQPTVAFYRRVTSCPASP